MNAIPLRHCRDDAQPETMAGAGVSDDAGAAGSATALSIVRTSAAASLAALAEAAAASSES
ncbi:hypothetical protein NS277_01305 [Novosphingobium barchaimii]|nr:hypothetical protein NS277_01305 [Novosphingobium barchaimii]